MSDVNNSLLTEKTTRDDKFWELKREVEKRLKEKGIYGDTPTEEVFDYLWHLLENPQENVTLDRLIQKRLEERFKPTSASDPKIKNLTPDESDKIKGSIIFDLYQREKDNPVYQKKEEPETEKSLLTEETDEEGNKKIIWDDQRKEYVRNPKYKSKKKKKTKVDWYSGDVLEW